MEKQATAYETLHLGLIVISQGTPAVLQQFLKRHPKPYPVVGDPDRHLYHSAGLDRVSVASFLKPRVILHYLKELRRGATLHRPYAGEDVLQRGGDFVVRPSGEVLFSHQSPDSTSRPRVDDLLQVVRGNFATNR